MVQSASNRYEPGLIHVSNELLGNVTPRPTTLNISSHKKYTFKHKKYKKFQFPPLLATRSQSAPGSFVNKKQSESLVVNLTNRGITSTTTRTPSSYTEEIFLENDIHNDKPKIYDSTLYQILIYTLVLLVICGVVGSLSIMILHLLIVKEKLVESEIESSESELIESSPIGRIVHPKDLRALIVFNRA